MTTRRQEIGNQIAQLEAEDSALFDQQLRQAEADQLRQAAEREARLLRESVESKVRVEAYFENQVRQAALVSEKESREQQEYRQSYFRSLPSLQGLTCPYCSGSLQYPAWWYDSNVRPSTSDFVRCSGCGQAVLIRFAQGGVSLVR